MDIKASCMVPWKCYENTFDGPKSRVMKVDEEGWLEEKGRKETEEKQRKSERKRERDTSRLLARNVYACCT